MRIHSLPDARRYPTSGSDQRELLRRHNAVASDVLREGHDCSLLLYDPADSDNRQDVGARIGLPGHGLRDLGLLPSWLWEDDHGHFVEPMTLRGVTVMWRKHALDSFVLAAANDAIRGLVVDNHTGQVYAPYDGGADLFFASEAIRDEARLRHSRWLSDRPDGL